MINKTLINYIKENILPKYNAQIEIINNEVVLHVFSDRLVGLLRNLRDDSASLFAMLISICGVDNPNNQKRFTVVYNLLSLKFNARIRVKVATDIKTPVASITELFDAAAWYEREVFDMYGIKFSGNKDLRRILTDYNFQHFPLRKDFPLTGYEEVRYDLEKKQVVYEPVQLDQEYRNFDYLSPWEGELGSTILPGDEKCEASDE